LVPFHRCLSGVCFLVGHVLRSSPEPCVASSPFPRDVLNPQLRASPRPDQGLNPFISTYTFIQFLCLVPTPLPSYFWSNTPPFLGLTSVPRCFSMPRCPLPLSRCARLPCIFFLRRAATLDGRGPPKFFSFSFSGFR